MRYIFSSAVITSPGTYRYDLLSVLEAQLWLAAGPALSTIGYPETCVAFEALLGVRVAVNRTVTQMAVGDEALVFRLVLPPGTPRITPQSKGLLTAEYVREHSEIGLLKRVE